MASEELSNSHIIDGSSIHTISGKGFHLSGSKYTQPEKNRDVWAVSMSLESVRVKDRRREDRLGSGLGPYLAVNICYRTYGFPYHNGMMVSIIAKANFG